MWKSKLSLWIILFGVLGYLLAWGYGQLGPVETSSSQIYLFFTMIKEVFFAALKMLVTPIVLFSLLGGMLQISEVGQLGKIGQTTVTYYLATTTIAIVIGLFVVFFIHPWEQGEKIQSEKQQIEQTYEGPKKSIDEKDANVISVFRNMAKRVFVNPLDAFVSNNILGLVFWAFLIGIAFITLGNVDKSIVNFINDGNRILGKILSWVILFAPIGVFSIAFTFYFQYAGTILWQLISFMAVVFFATMLHGLVVLPTILKLFTDVPVKEFFKKASKPLLLALTTSSSAAALPVSMQTCTEEFGVKERVSSFVLPLGATMNMDGTALFEGIAAVFLAYIFGIELSTFAMLSIFFMAVISSVGAPGMPSGSMSGMQMVLIAAGIPLEGIGVLMVIERPLDTFRTAVNVEGDIIGTLVVNHRENAVV